MAMPTEAPREEEPPGIPVAIFQAIDEDRSSDNNIVSYYISNVAALAGNSIDPVSTGCCRYFKSFVIFLLSL